MVHSVNLVEREFTELEFEADDDDDSYKCMVELSNSFGILQTLIEENIQLAVDNVAFQFLLDVLREVENPERALLVSLMIWGCQCKTLSFLNSRLNRR